MPYSGATSGVNLGNFGVVSNNGIENTNGDGILISVPGTLSFLIHGIEYFKLTNAGLNLDGNVITNLQSGGSVLSNAVNVSDLNNATSVAENFAVDYVQNNNSI